MHDQGAVLCSACSGIFLLAETGLYDGRDVTVHFNYARAFTAAYPTVPVHPDRVLIISGAREELVSSGASVTWHDMVLHLIARYAGSTAAQEVARRFALQWHHDGLTPYIVFEGRTDHGDAEIERAQQWLGEHFSIANPVEEMIKRSSLSERTFKRRFVSATGLTPIAYVQRLRIEDARSAGTSATRIPRSSAGYSNARPVSLRAPIENASAFPSSRAHRAARVAVYDTGAHLRSFGW
jgi:transcriptional regulator GlxA family with amidase domain